MIFIWNELENAWQECFKQVWESFCKGSKPIGAVVIDNNGNIVACGRNTIFEKEENKSNFCMSEISHAELNALSKLNTVEHPEVNKYVLYTTMEPCPLCFGALYMSGVRNLKYAARDRWAGSTNLYGTTEYLSRKDIKIEGPIKDLESVSIVLNAYSELMSGTQKSIDTLLSFWGKCYSKEVILGKKWFEKGRLASSTNCEENIEDIFNEILSELNEV